LAYKEIVPFLAHPVYNIQQTYKKLQTKRNNQHKTIKNSNLAITKSHKKLAMAVRPPNLYSYSICPFKSLTRDR